MKAMLFCAGLGTRLQPFTNNHPKALAVVNGQTLLERNIRYLQQYGINEVVVNVHHFAGQIMDLLHSTGGWGTKIHISDETAQVLETGGGLIKAQPFLAGDEPFVTMNVDILTDLNLRAMLAFHHTNNSLITLAVSQRPSARKLLFSTNESLCGWRNTITEDERIVVPEQNLIEKAFSGISLFHPSIFDHITQTGKFSILDSFLSLAPAYPVYGFDHTGATWIDVGTMESLRKAETLFRT